MKISTLNYSYKTSFKGSDSLRDLINDALKGRTGNLFNNISDSFVSSDSLSQPSQPIVIEKLEITTSDGKKSAKDIAGGVITGGAGVASGAAIGGSTNSKDNQIDFNSMIDEKAKEGSATGPFDNDIDTDEGHNDIEKEDINNNGIPDDEEFDEINDDD